MPCGGVVLFPRLFANALGLVPITDLQWPYREDCQGCKDADTRRSGITPKYSPTLGDKKNLYVSFQYKSLPTLRDKTCMFYSHTHPCQPWEIKTCTYWIYGASPTVQADRHSMSNVMNITLMSFAPLEIFRLGQPGSADLWKSACFKQDSNPLPWGWQENMLAPVLS